MSGPTATAVETHDLSFFYGDRQSLCELTFTVQRGEVFGILGPNGGGKTTLFRLLATLIPLQQGRAAVLGFDLRRQIGEIRRRLGVVFQHSSLDRKLTVAENMRQQAILYGLPKKVARKTQDELLAGFGLAERANDRVETLSGGMRRRVELAKGMINRPELLLMDEPSAGLDPGARIDLWRQLGQLRDEFQVTIVLTTHLLEEADRCDRLAILDEGRLVALDSPDALRASVGGDTITMRSRESRSLAEAIRREFEIDAQTVDDLVRLEQPEGQQWVPRLVEAFAPQIETITLGKATLEDVFISKTGRRFSGDPEN